MSTADISSIDPSLSLDEIIAIQQLLLLGKDTEFKSEFKSKSPTKDNDKDKDKSDEVLKLARAKVFDEEDSENGFEVVLVGWKTYFRDINDGKMYDPDTQELVGEDGKLY